MKKVLYHLSLLIFIACTNSNNKNTNNNGSDFIEINIDTINSRECIYFSALFEDCKIIPLETKEESLIGRISDLKCYNNYIIIRDGLTKSIKLFDVNGSFIKNIGKKGKGKGEYLYVSSFSVNDENGHIVCFDRLTRKVITYDINGNLISEFKIQTGVIVNSIRVQSEYIYVDIMISSKRPSEYFLLVFNGKGEIVKEMMPTEIYSSGFTQALNSSYNFSYSGDETKYKVMFSDTVYNLNGLQLSPSIVLKSKDKINSEDIEDLNNTEKFRDVMNKYGDIRKFKGINQYLENDSLIYIVYDNEITKRILINKSDSMMVFTNKLIDDITYIHKPNFIRAEKNYFISYISDPDKIQKFIADFGKTKGQDKSLHNVTIDSNPIILLYKTKRTW